MESYQSILCVHPKLIKIFHRSATVPRRYCGFVGMTSGKVAGNVLQNFSRLLARGSKEAVATEWGWSPEGRTSETFRKRAGRLPNVFVRIICLLVCGSANSWWLEVLSKCVYVSTYILQPFASIPLSLPFLSLSLSVSFSLFFSVSLSSLSLFLLRIYMSDTNLSKAFTFDEQRDRGYLRTDGRMSSCCAK